MFRERLTVRALLAFSTCIALCVAGCDAGPRPPGRDGGATDAMGRAMCIPGMPGVRCDGDEAVDCLPDGSDGMRYDCAAAGEICVNGLGCRVCRPNSYQCTDNTVEVCNAMGTGWEPGPTCDAALGQMCNSVTGTCTSPCEQAAAANSYIGCEYFPVTTLNSQVDPAFSPAIVVTNPQSEQASLTVTGPNGFSQTRTLSPQGVETVELPWVAPLKSTLGAEASALVTGGAYHVRSTLPVTVYQFNPLEYRLDQDCIDEAGQCDGSTVDDFFGFPVCDDLCFSFSNDASLLLPAHVMTGNYLAMSRPTLVNRIDPGTGPQMSASPGFITIVGVSPTPVSVDVHYRGAVVGGPGVTGGASGTTERFTLAQGDVVQLVGGAPSNCTPGDSDTVGAATVEYCTVTAEYDLTGTEIRANGPVEVLSGHNCAFVPYNRWACDHLEEAMFPLETWGDETIVSASQPLRSEPNLIRIISGSDGNALTFDPAPPGVSASTLNRGEVLEFEATESFRVSGSAALMVTQLLVGQDYAGYATAGEMGQGDPAMSLGIPTEQFRTEYSFLAPTTYSQSFVNVTAPTGASVTLDGGAVTGFTPVGDTGFSVARVEIGGGPHNITSDQPFGIVVYGFGSYTSYMYPGGLDFEQINLF